MSSPDTKVKRLAKRIEKEEEDIVYSELSLISIIDNSVIAVRNILTSPREADANVLGVTVMMLLHELAAVRIEIKPHPDVNYIKAACARFEELLREFNRDYVQNIRRSMLDNTTKRGFLIIFDRIVAEYHQRIGRQRIAG